GSRRKPSISTRACNGCAKCSGRSADQRFAQDELRPAVGKSIDPARYLVAESVIKLRCLEGERIEIEQPAAAIYRRRLDLAHQRTSDAAAPQRLVDPYLL